MAFAQLEHVATPVRRAAGRWTGRWTGLGPGLAVAVPAGVVATLAGTALPVIGAPVIALLLGATAGALLRRRTPDLAAGFRFGSSTLLQVAVVLLGAQISLGEVARVGLGSLPVMLLTLGSCLGVAALAGRLLGVDAELRTLVGIGTGVCGASAIAAVSSVTRPRANSIAYAISTIFCFNVIAVLVFPPLGHLLHLSQQDFGLFAGTAVNDTSSVVAASTAYGGIAAHHAIVVKLTRTLMIVPICGVLGARSGALGAGPVRRLMRLVPWFLIGFVVMAGLNSSGIIEPGVGALLDGAAVLLTAIAMAAIGGMTDIGALRRTGPKPLVLGTVLWLVVTATSLLAQATL